MMQCHNYVRRYHKIEMSFKKLDQTLLPILAFTFLENKNW